MKRLAVCFFLLGLSILFTSGAAVANVFSFGDNSTGQTGLDTIFHTTPVATPIDTSNLNDMRITQVSAGNRHSLLLAEKGSVFSFGTNQQGVTGLGSFIGDTMVATPIITTNLGGRTISQVAAGHEHSLLLAEDGSVFSFGYNGNGATGLGVDNPFAVSLATPINTAQLGGRTITQVAAGGSHSLLLADDGSVFSFGQNEHGQTGLGISGFGATLIATPINTSQLGSRKITQVAAGGLHSLLLADDGSVFSFGYDGGGATGLGIDGFNSATTVATPIVTSNLGGRKIVQLAAGDIHSLLLAEDGSVFSFGSNSSGLTGLGTDIGITPVATPIDTTNLGGLKITQIAAGSAHSLLLAEDGSVFSFGSNWAGRTGLGIDGFDSITTVATPIITTNLGGMRVSQLTAGGNHSLLIAVPEPSAGLLTTIGLLAALKRQCRRQMV